MIFLVITLYLPPEIREAARFFLEHPENSTTVTYMNLFDIGAAAFIFIMGILMPYSFSRRRDTRGTKKTVLHLILRYSILLALGLVIILIDHGSFFEMIGGVPIIYWDVLPTLGLVGLIAIPFLFINYRYRAIIAGFMLIFYQLMVMYGGWREYAIESIHGGILGSIFSFSSLMIFATCFGEYLLMNDSLADKKKYITYFLIGLIIFIVGLLISFIPGWYPNKRQVTLTYILISMGASIALTLICIGLDKLVKKPIFILDSFGKNPLLIYIVAVVIEYIIVDLIGIELNLLLGILFMAIVTIIALLLDRTKKIIKL